MNIASVFGSAARDYDATRKKYISCFDDFYGVAVALIPYPADAHFKLLDLGAGTGLFSSLVKAVFPNCTITVTDISTEMLDQARQRFAGDPSVNYLQHDYINEPLTGEYDVIISGLSLHHSTQTELQSVFNKLYSCLKNNGVFINADQILGRTPEIEKAYEAAWLRQARDKMCTPEEIQVALNRMKADKTLPLSVQLQLLEKAGFAKVNCWYQYYRFAVYSGIRQLNKPA